MKQKKSIQGKIVKHAHRRRFQDYVRTKGRDKMTIGYVYWNMFLRSGKGNVFELAEELFLADLGITHPTLSGARKTLITDGWLGKSKQTFNPETGRWSGTRWVVNEEADVNSVDNGTAVKSTDVNSTDSGSTDSGSVYNTVVLHSQYANASTSSCTPSASTPPEGRKEGTASPLPPALIQKLEAGWKARTGTGFVNGDVEAAAKLVEEHGGDVVESYMRDTFSAPRTAKVAWRDFGFWAQNYDRTRRNIDAWRRTTKAKPGTHATVNPELHTGLDAQGKSWVGEKCKVCGLVRTDNPDGVCDTCL